MLPWKKLEIISLIRRLISQWIVDRSETSHLTMSRMEFQEDVKDSKMIFSTVALDKSLKGCFRPSSLLGKVCWPFKVREG